METRTSYPSPCDRFRGDTGPAACTTTAAFSNGIANIKRRVASSISSFLVFLLESFYLCILSRQTWIKTKK